VLLLCAVGACSTETAHNTNFIPPELHAALRTAEQFELLSLDPDRQEVEPSEAFHGWKVLGTTTVTEAAVREELIAALENGVRNAFVPAECFIPRHGIRLTSGGVTTDFVICFQCAQVQAFVADKPAQGFLTTGSPQAVFDNVLKAAKVPLPAAADE
jgi:hypothetical protein